MRHAFEFEGVEHEVWLGRASAGGYALHALGRIVPVVLSAAGNGAGTLDVDGRVIPVVIALRGDDVFVHLDGANHRLRLRHALERAAAEGHAGADDLVRAPMPGTPVSVSVQAGERVQRGAPLLVMESMKLETTITAPRDARIHAVHVAPGQPFDRDAVLISLEPPDEP